MARKYATKGRLKAKHTTMDGITFDSAFEAAVYRQLKRVRYVDVDRQYKVTIKPPSPNFPAKFWGCDFIVQPELPSNELFLLVEAKGLITSEFINSMQLLELTDPQEYSLLLIVFPDAYSGPTLGKSDIKKAEKMGLKYCFLSDVKDTVKTRLNIPNL